MEVEAGNKEGAKGGPGGLGEERMKVDLEDKDGDELQLNNDDMSLKLGENEEDSTAVQEGKSDHHDNEDVLTTSSNSKNSEADSAAGVESHRTTTEILYNKEFDRRFLNKV